MKDMKDWLRSTLIIGTPQCGALGALLGAVLAVLLLTIGLWKTLFIAAFALLGVWMGGVRSKTNFIRSIINRSFPEKGEAKVDTYEDVKNKP